MEFSVDKAIGFIINKAAVRCTTILSDAFHEERITPQQWGLLNRLAERDGLSQTEIAKLIIIDPTNLTRMIDKLVERGVVRRERDAHDRRAQLIYMTEAGHQLRARLIPLAKEAERQLLVGIAPDEIATTIRTLQKMMENSYESKN